jgi:hypothetical protein
VSEPQAEFSIRINNKDTLGRVLGFCDVHRANLDLQGLIDGIVTGDIVVLPLRDESELLNAVKIHEVLLRVIDETFPTLSKTINRISAAYRLALDLSE